MEHHQLWPCIKFRELSCKMTKGTSGKVRLLPLPCREGFCRKFKCVTRLCGVSLPWLQTDDGHKGKRVRCTGATGAQAPTHTHTHTAYGISLGLFPSTLSMIGRKRNRDLNPTRRPNAPLTCPSVSVGSCSVDDTQWGHCHSVSARRA